MEKIVIFLNSNKISFATLKEGETYLIVVGSATDQQSHDLIDLITKQKLVFRIRGGIAIHEPIPVETKTAAKK